MIVGCFKNTQQGKNHFTQFGECGGDDLEGWTVQDTLFQLRAQNRVQRNLVSVRVIAGAWKTNASVKSYRGSSKVVFKGFAWLGL